MINMSEVFVVVPKTNGEKSELTKIGVAFENRDGGLNVILDAVPLSGRLYIRKREKDKKEIKK